jgi:hypothetical protein
MELNHNSGLLLGNYRIMIESGRQGKLAIYVYNLNTQMPKDPVLSGHGRRPRSPSLFDRMRG